MWSAVRGGDCGLGTDIGQGVAGLNLVINQGALGLRLSSPTPFVPAGNYSGP